MMPVSLQPLTLRHALILTIKVIGVGGEGGGGGVFIMHALYWSILNFYHVVKEKKSQQREFVWKQPGVNVVDVI